MCSNKALKKFFTLILIVIIVSSATTTFTSTPIASTISLKIPEIQTNAVEIVAENIGPLAPGIIKPGGCLNLTLRFDVYSIRGAYAWMISEERDVLKLYNYTLSIYKYDGRVLEICAPSNIINGVYDLVLIAEQEYTLPRSLWVLSNNLKKLKIAVFSDLHIETGSPTPREGDINRFSAALITHWVNPDLIIWGGDITDTGSEYEAQIAQVYRYTYLYKYPVLSVAGNHDWPGGSYTKYLGPLRWIRIIGDKLLVIGIYTVPYAGIEGVLPPEDVILLEQALFNYSYIPYKIIVFHYPMFYYQGELTTRYDDEVTLKPYTQGVVTPVSSYWSSNMTAFRYVLKLIEDYNVTVVIAGHIHRDQFVKYTSTRTNTTTYFMTFTSTAHGVALYNGVGLFELDLESGELNFPLQPPGFTGFMNRTPPIASNSLPVGVNVGGGLTYIPIRIFYSTTGYKIIFENKYSWYNDLSAKLLWVFPWISSQSTQIISTTNSTGNASISILDKKLIINKLFTLIELKLPYTTRVELSLYTIEDIKPPIIELFRNIPNTPILNKTLTLYFNIYDSEWGVNVESLKVFFNGTSITIQVLKPINYISHHNNASLKIDLLVRNTNITTTTLKIEIADLNGKITQKLYRVIYYPPGAIPTEHPIEEIEVEEKPTQTTTTETPTTSPTTTPIQTPAKTTSITPTHTPPYSTTTPTSTMQTTSPTSSPTLPGIQGLYILVFIVILVVVFMAVYAIRAKK